MGQIADHKEYLAEGSMDPSKEFAEKLSDELIGTGSILVYTGYEKQIINALAGQSPSLSDELNSIIGRLVDLDDILQKNLHHPELHGSTSLKTTLPVLEPETLYDHIPVNNGDSATSEFSLLAMSRYSDEEASVVRSNLLEYCKIDT